MSKRKFRKHNRHKKLEFIGYINKRVCHPPNEISLTEEDKIIYIYETDLYTKKVEEVVNVSYQIFIDNNWVTILRFDSEHGYLHGHMRISQNNSDEVFIISGVKKKGSPHSWLTWSIEFIKKRYLDYKKGFLKRSLRFDS